MTGIHKITVAVAIIFMLTSLSLAYLSSETARDSVVREIESAPAKPSVQEQTEALNPENEKKVSEDP